MRRSFRQELSRLRRGPARVRREADFAFRDIVAYRDQRSQLRLIRDEAAALRGLAGIGDGWLRGVDFYSPRQLTRVLSRTFAQFHGAHGRYPNLTAPQGFNERLASSNFFRPMKIPESGNKLLTPSFIPPTMRESVRCPPIMWSGDRLDWRDLDRLAAGETYFLKSSHGSSMARRFTWPISNAERSELRTLGARWLRHRFGLADGEWWYNAFSPMLIIETDVGGNGFSVNCFCFKGAVGLVVLHARATGETITLGEGLGYIGQKNGDSDWREHFEAHVLHRIVDIAAELSRNIEFARFDFLVGDSGEIFLGEVTFSPGNGHSTRPDGVDEHLGRLWAASAQR